MNRRYTTDERRVNRRLCSSSGLHRISFVRAFVVTSIKELLNSLKRKRGSVHPGEWTGRRPILTDPASPRPPAVRCPALSCPWYARVFLIRQVFKTVVLDAVFVRLFARRTALSGSLSCAASARPARWIIEFRTRSVVF